MFFYAYTFLMIVNVLSTTNLVVSGSLSFAENEQVVTEMCAKKNDKKCTYFFWVALWYNFLCFGLFSDF